jgi:hypothetical protein
MTQNNKSESDAIRERINVLAIIRALEDHILNGTEMGATQIKAALVLLKKAVPDVTAAAEAKNREISKEEMLKILKKHEDALQELE